MWFNNIEIKEVRETNGWTVIFAETKNGHKVRGITKFEMPAAIVGNFVNMSIKKVDKATYVNAVVARTEAA